MKASYKIFLSVCYNRVVKFKFINLNVWLGGKIWNPMIDFLKKEDPDILALQEVFNSHDPMLTPNFRTMDEFNKIFDYKYAEKFTFKHDDTNLLYFLNLLPHHQRKHKINVLYTMPTCTRLL